MTLKTAHLRIARATDNLDEITRFYGEGLGFEVIASFKDHDGFDGVMFGHKGAPYHLEFTQCSKHIAGRAPNEDNLLVFYLPELDEWKAAVQKMYDCGYKTTISFNPYWDVHGKTFEDADGYRIVLQNAGWNI